MDGVLLADKPAGCTSHDVVSRVRHRFKIAKVGHAGTLDPFATGLLVLLVGRATKMSGQLMGLPKSYEGTAHLGVATDSHDTEGKVTATRSVEGLTAESIGEHFARFNGTFDQLPPMFSAVKVNGKRLYKLARKGIETERTARKITVCGLRLVFYAAPDAFFEMSCSSGTYVRKLIHDIGESIGCGAYLTALRRTAVGPFGVAQALPLAEIEKSTAGELCERLIGLERLKGLAGNGDLDPGA